jgi:hypothetical protein
MPLTDFSPKDMKAIVACIRSMSPADTAEHLAVARSTQH